MSLSYRNVAEILKAIDESQADEIEIEIEGLRLAVRKHGAGNPAAPLSSAEATAAIQPESRIVETKEPAPKPKPPDETRSQAPPGHEIIRSPTVGTFYRRPSPDEEAFVEPGSTIEAGSPLCLIEVMKLYTTIETPVSGTIVSIFAEDGNLVEFDQQLFLIRKNS